MTPLSAELAPSPENNEAIGDKMGQWLLHGPAQLRAGRHAGGVAGLCNATVAPPTSTPRSPGTTCSGSRGARATGVPRQNSRLRPPRPSTGSPSGCTCRTRRTRGSKSAPPRGLAQRRGVLFRCRDGAARIGGRGFLRLAGTRSCSRRRRGGAARAVGGRGRPLSRPASRTTATRSCRSAGPRDADRFAKAAAGIIVAARLRWSTFALLVDGPVDVQCQPALVRGHGRTTICIRCSTRARGC